MPQKKKNKSIEAIVKSAKDLFWKYGIARVTVEEICQNAAVSKMTFYRNFSNKQAVAKEVLRTLVERSTTHYNKIMLQEIPYSQKIRQVIEMKHEFSMGISQEFMQDVYQNEDKELSAIMEKYRAENLERVMADLREAQEKGWIRKDLQLSFVLYMMNDIGSKLMDKNLTSLYLNISDLIMELTNFFFYGILPHDDKEI